MPPPQLGGSLSTFNAFYQVDDPENNEKITGAVRSLEGAVVLRGAGLRLNDTCTQMMRCFD